MEESTNGKIQAQSEIVPVNLNPKQSVTDVYYVKGAPQTFANVADLVALHPGRMKKSMQVGISDWPITGTISVFRLAIDPNLLLDASLNSIITEDNFQLFWVLDSQVITPRSRVTQYAPDGPGGGTPVFPYVPDEEDNWSNVYNAARGHKWLRFRDDDVDANDDGIFDNWSIPISIGAQFQTGDYVENRFRRQAVSESQHTGIGTLSAGKYYQVETGSVTIDGDLSLNDIGYYGTDTEYEMAVGRVFKYDAANSYTFNDSGYVLETLQTPPRSIAGLANNEPSGWDDTIPVGSAQLWEITAQKSVYQQLKTDWILKKIIEDANYVRYSDSPSPHPDTIVGVNTSATSGSGGDIALEAAGWHKVYGGEAFIATRDNDDPDLYTPWLVQKIQEESGEYTDRAFKLFDLNLDLDSVVLQPPTHRDATVDGFSDTPLLETDTQINYITEVRKFFNGELKTSWSALVPYTGKSTFLDVIDSDLGDNFKYDAADVVTPDAITLTAKIYKGTTSLWINSAIDISYVWKKVFDNGAIVDISPTDDSGDDFYKLATSGTPDTSDYLRDDQRVVVKPDAVTGNAIFQCVQTVTLIDGGPIVFTQQFSIIDVSDGIDAKALAIAADAQTLIYDTDNLVFVPNVVTMRGYTSNIVSPTFYWYKWNGSSWVSLTGDPDYNIASNYASFDPADVFAADSTAEQALYAVSTHATNPDAADYDTTFSDYITIAKLSAAGVGTDGINAVTVLLNNESHTVVLDSTTGTPQSGEAGTSTDKARTLLQLYDGNTKKVYGGGADYTVAVASDNADVVFNYAASGNDAVIYVDSWASPARSARCTITITYGAYTLTKIFSVASTLDAPGALILDIDSDKGYVFTPSDKTTKTLTARLYDTSLTPGSQEIPAGAPYEYRWKIGGASYTSWSTTKTKSLTRSSILASGVVILQARNTDIDTTAQQQRTITISDVNDGTSYRAWTDNSTKPSGSQDLSNQDPLLGSWPYTISGVVWRLPTDSHWATNIPTYAQDATENAGTYTWLPVYQLKGEQGDQGPAGNFMFPMYKVQGSAWNSGTTYAQYGKASYNGKAWISKVAGNLNHTPAENSFWTEYALGGNTSTLAQMLSAGWTSLLPISGIIWKSDRLWTGDGVTFNGSGDPSTGPVTGGVWTPPLKLTTTDGTNGNDGNDGGTGWSPVYSVVAGANAGEKVLQLIDWTGGDLPKPGFINYYVGSSGLVSNIALANPVTGTPVEMQYNSSTGYIQWKYTSEGGGSWRNLVLDAVATVEIGTASFPAPIGESNPISTLKTSNAFSIGGTSKPYRRLAKIMLTEGPLIRANGSAPVVMVEIQANINSAPTWVTVGHIIDQITCTTPNVYQRPQVVGMITIPANQTFALRVDIAFPFVAGSFILSSSQPMAIIVELTPY